MVSSQLHRTVRTAGAMPVQGRVSRYRASSRERSHHHQDLRLQVRQGRGGSQIAARGLAVSRYVGCFQRSIRGVGTLAGFRIWKFLGNFRTSFPFSGLVKNCGLVQVGIMAIFGLYFSPSPSSSFVKHLYPRTYWPIDNSDRKTNCLTKLTCPHGRERPNPSRIREKTLCPYPSVGTYKGLMMMMLKRIFFL